MSKTKNAVYPGTFDPITLGHLDVIKRALKIFDSITIAVTTNNSKKPLFSLNERVALVKKTIKEINSDKIQVESFNGLLVDFLKQKNSHIVVRGLRELSDFESEFQQAVVNRKLAPEIDSVFIMTDARYFYVSSSMVKEISKFKGSLDKFVPLDVEKALRKKFAGKR